MEVAPLISFIITYHDEPADMLTACISSILALGLSNEEREIILVDDGSSLSPMNLLATETMEQISYLRQSNQGLSAARNNGMSHARGTYIQFVDADDTLLTQSYNHGVAYLRDTQPDMLLFPSTTRQDYRFNRQNFSNPLSGPAYMSSHNLRPAAWGYLFRRTLSEGLSFPVGLLHEDEYFTPLLTLRAGNLSEMKAPAYFYRQRQGSIMNDNRQSERRMADYEKVIDELKAEMRRQQETACKKALERRIHQMSMAAIYNAMTLIDDERKREEYISHLTQTGLFPLPLKCHTTTYLAFSILTRTHPGRRLAAAIIGMLPNKGKKQ